MKYYFFEKDIKILEQKINGLCGEIKELGKTQGEVSKQSTENFGHDDACQEVIYSEPNILIEKLRNLRETASMATIIEPKKSYEEIRIGAVVQINNGDIFRIGSFMVLADHLIMNISYQALLGKRREMKFYFVTSS